MNSSQTVFALFFAIFWGASANVHPKWKPFQVPLIFSRWPFGRKVLSRVVLSMVLLNVLPLAYFSWRMLLLGDSCAASDEWNTYAVVRLVIQAVVPAFAVFSFYHFWLSFVEGKGELFYAKDKTEMPPHSKMVPDAKHIIDPTLKELGIRSENWWRNLVCAILYFGTAIAVPWIWK